MEVNAALVTVSEPTHVSEARRRAADIAHILGVGELTGGRIALVVTEMATNLLKHAGGGEIFLGVTGATQRRGMQVVGMDRGRGIANITTSMVDGYSTAGSQGTGLGAIKRASDTFDIYSSAAGTVVAASIYPGEDAASLPIGAVSVPAPGERECGDGWAVWSAGGLTSVLVVDGLGHGHEAAIAAGAAIEMFERHAERSAVDVMMLVHNALKKTRGAAVALAELDERNARLTYCAVGNISAVVARPGGEEQHLITVPGIAGHAVRRMQTFSYEWPRGSLLVMHTDGLNTRWALSRYAGLQSHQPDVIAGVLFRDFRRGVDDATAVVTRHGKAA